LPTPEDRSRTARWYTSALEAVELAMKRSVRVKANMSLGSLHALRHTHASQLIADAMDVLTISRRLGHGSPTITLNIYGHLFAAPMTGPPT
jgi:integrase